MMENVPAIFNDPRLDLIQSQLGSLGYVSEGSLVERSGLGTPQRRRRMVLLAAMGKVPLFAPKRSYKKVREVGILTKMQTLTSG